MAYTQRINRTNLQFRNALLRLLDEKTLHRITVNEIATEAGFERSTFYNHYDDQEDLLCQIEDSVIDAIEKVRAASHVFTVNKTNLEQLVTLCDEQRFVLSRLFSDHGEGHFERRVTQVANQAFIDEYGPAYGTNPEIQLLRVGATASSLQMLKYWLTTDSPLTASQVAHALIAIQTAGPVKALASFQKFQNN